MNIPIFLSSDNNYAPFVATTIASICNNTKSFCKFYILDSGITKENKNKIYELKDKFNNFSIEFIYIDLEKEFKDIVYRNEGSYISLSTYSRFLIPKLKPELEKVIYMDVDVVALGDISELYKEPLDGYILGAMWDKTRKYYNTDTKDLMNLSEDYKYFNAGILLLDIKKWNKNDITKKLFDLEKKYRDNIKHADETLLNKYFDNNYKILNIRYNYTDYDIMTHPCNNIVIRHFATAMKPWNSNYCFWGECSTPFKNVEPLKNFEDFWHYAEMTSFFNEIKIRYNNAINKTFLSKRISLIADKIKKERINQRRKK